MSVEEILTYLMLVIVGYFIAKMFSKRCERLSVDGAYPLCPTTKVDACIDHYSNCSNLYTHTMDAESDYAVHTCKKGGLFNLYRCISSGNECVFPDGHTCEENADCNSTNCLDIFGDNIKKCEATSPPPPPPPSCPSGQSYCQSGDGVTPSGCYNNCSKGKQFNASCHCLPNCCFIKSECSNPDDCN